MQLSIITINYNNKEGLVKTINSVLNQTCKNFEYIIIDGGSMDGSVEIIKNNYDKINYWVSEKDEGIYHAMNKGIKVAKGKYLLFLNSGDYLISNSTIEDFLLETNDIDIIYGKRYTEYNDGRLVSFESYRKLSIELFFSGYCIPHQATLIKRDLFLKYGLYDESLKLVSDYKFFLLVIFKHNCTYILKDIYIVNFNADGISSSKDHFELWKNEIDSVINTEFSALVYLRKASKSLYPLISYKNESKTFKLFTKLGMFKFLREKLEMFESAYFDI